MPWSDGLLAGTPIAASANARIRVVAGPGTGKSFAMKRRVARLLEDGADPVTMLPVTFTRVSQLKIFTASWSAWAFPAATP